MSSPLLGLDIGTRRIGVALSPNALDVQPLETIHWDPPHTHKLTRDLLALVEEHSVATVVFGIPVSEEGDTTSQSMRNLPITRKVEQALLASFPELRIVTISEFNSTQEGRELYSHLDRDAAAACIILKRYLEEHV